MIAILFVLACISLLDRIAAPDGKYGAGLVDTTEAFIDWWDRGLLIDIGYTCFRVFIGMAIASVFAISVGMITGRFSDYCGVAVNGLNYLRAITPVALAPFFLIFFGISEYSKVLLVAWGAFFPIWVNAHLGVRSLSSELVASAKLIGLSRLNLIRHFYIPATIRASYPGARVAIGISFILVFISETLGAANGVGYQLGVAYDTVQIPKMLAALLLLGALGLFADRLFVFTLAAFYPWVIVESENGN